MKLSDEIITAVSVPRHFAEARTPEGFAAVRVDPELGTVAWPGGADFAPDTLYVRVKTGAWPSLDGSIA
jgi:hypothetical protein